jgi:hypothetical protein
LDDFVGTGGVAGNAYFCELAQIADARPNPWHTMQRLKPWRERSLILSTRFDGIALRERNKDGSPKADAEQIASKACHRTSAHWSAERASC